MDSAFYLDSILKSQERLQQKKFSEALENSANTIKKITASEFAGFFYVDNLENKFVSLNLSATLSMTNPLVRGLSVNKPQHIENKSILFLGNKLDCFYVCGIFDEDQLRGVFILAREQSPYCQEEIQEIDGLLLTAKNILVWLFKIKEDDLTYLKLKENETRYRNLFENVVDAIITINVDGVIESFNSSAEKMFAYDRSEVIGRNVKMLMPEPYQSEHDTYIDNYINKGSAAKIIGIGREVYGKRKGGQIFPIDLAVGEMQIDGKKIFTGIARDISDRRLAEQKIRENALRLNAVVENVVDGIITIDVHGNIQSMNTAAENLFGYKREEMIGKNVKLFMPEPYRSEHDVFLRNYSQTGNAKVIGLGREVSGLRRDGSIFPMELAVGEVQLENERLFTGIVRDISERKRIEKMKNEFVSTVSHELRTPLTSIRGALGLLCSGVLGEITGEAQKMLHIANNNTQRLLLLVNDILDIQKMESNSVSFKFAPININEFLQKVIHDNHGLAEERNVQFKLHPLQREAVVFADSERLMQVFNNLLSNASKFSPEGEKIDLTIGIDTGMVRVAVRDRGVGVPDKFRGKLFDKFTQLDSSDTRKLGGTGLGLSICKLIMEKHGGKIAYQPAEGSGSIFSIELPELITSARNIRPKNLAKGSRVLVIEDEPQIAMMIQSILADMGVDSDVAQTVKQARDLLRKNNNRYQCVTLDILLPGESGVELLHDLKSNTEWNVPVIVLSVNVDDVMREYADEFDLVHYWLAKPIDVDMLKSKLSELLDESGRILHVEDDSDLHDVVRNLIGDKYIIDWCETVDDGKRLLTKNNYDLVLLDLSLPDGSGKELIEWIHNNKINVKILVFSAYEMENSRNQHNLQSLVKSKTSNGELLDTIDRVMKKNG